MPRPSSCRSAAAASPPASRAPRSSRPHARAAPLRIIGVQAENAAPYVASLAAGEPRQVPVVPTIADGIAVYRPGELNFAIIRDTIDEVVTVSEDDIARALLVLLERAKLVVEPAGAVAVAAMMTGAVQSDGPVVAVLSGGNIDPHAHAAGRGARARGIRSLPHHQRRPARPPGPARTGRGAPRRGERERHRGAAHAARRRACRSREVELRLSVETRGPEHREAVVEVLRRAGYDPKVEVD